MKINKIKHKLIGLSISLFLVSGIGFFFAAEAHGQYRGNRQIWRDNRTSYGSIHRIAHAEGYSDGLREGAKAARSRKRYNPYGAGRYKKATNGYKSRYGSKEAYKRSYRQGFLRGYDENFYRNSRNNRRIW